MQGSNLIYGLLQFVQCLCGQQSHVSMQRTGSWPDQTFGIIPDILSMLLTSLVLQLPPFALITPDGLVQANLVLQIRSCLSRVPALLPRSELSPSLGLRSQHVQLQYCTHSRTPTAPVHLATGCCILCMYVGLYTQPFNACSDIALQLLGVVVWCIEGRNKLKLEINDCLHD